jgi:precorrin-2/cobalt-factor-2 C20-methyltransferase
MRSGKLYVIGVGPGDPELLTIKGVRILNEISCLCVPKGREEGSSLALSIVKRIVNLEGKEIIEAHFPMKKTRNSDHGSELDPKWNETVRTVLSRLSHGIDMAFITIGDPAIYSTFFYLYERLLESNPELHVEIIPGVSSINASAALARISLGLADEKIALLPATYLGNLREIFETFDTIVLMKVHRVFDKVLEILDELHLTANAVYVSRVGMEDEKIARDITTLKEEDLNYFSMVIVRK